MGGLCSGKKATTVQEPEDKNSAKSNQKTTMKKGKKTTSYFASK